MPLHCTLPALLPLQQRDFEQALQNPQPTGQVVLELIQSLVFVLSMHGIFLEPKRSFRIPAGRTTGAPSPAISPGRLALRLPSMPQIIRRSLNLLRHQRNRLRLRV